MSPSDAITRGAELSHPEEVGALNLSTRALLAAAPPSLFRSHPSFMSHQDVVSMAPSHQFLANQLTQMAAGVGNNPAANGLPSTLLSSNLPIPRPPMQLTNDLTLTPLEQYSSLAQQLSKHTTTPTLSHAQALSIMTSLHWAQSQRNLENQARLSHREDDHDDESDIEVTDPEDTLEDSPKADIKRKFSARNNCEAQDLSVKKQKLEFNEDDNPEWKITSNIQSKPLMSIPNDFLDLICRNNKIQAEWKNPS